MAPKIKITKDDIVAAALELVRLGGEDALNTRAIASRLGCSTQPIFSNFSSMEDLRNNVIEAARKICEEYTEREIKSGEFPIYKASGMAYIRFAEEEKQLFKLLYMRDRGEEDTTDEDTQASDASVSIIKKNLGLDEEVARLFHLEIWALVHGIASMTATGFLNLDRELISRMLTDSYQGLKNRFGKG